MAKLYVDTNFLFDLTERDTDKRELLEHHQVFVSPLSYHILFYTYRHKVPQEAIINHKSEFCLVDLTDKILSHALLGPTSDLEDNIQLHSAAEAECDYFLTSDRNLLKLKFFGKTQLLPTLLSPPPQP